MRERLLEAFDIIRIDCLNGDKYKTGKVAPDGSPDPSIFSSREDPVGIQVGTGIATLVRKGDHHPAAEVGFRHLWGQAKREELTATAEAEPETLYEEVKPILPLGLPFVRTKVSDDWFDWPALPDLFPVSFPGVKTSRDAFLVDTDLDRLKARVSDYFDPARSHEEIARLYPSVMKSTARYDAQRIRDTLLARGSLTEGGFVRFAYRPFDNRWLYWEADTKLLDEKRADYKSHVFDGNLWLVLQNKARPDLSPPLVISDLGDLNQMNSGVYCVPLHLESARLGAESQEWSFWPNLSTGARSYLDRVGANPSDLFHHVVAVLHDPKYQRRNADALRASGPRIPERRFRVGQVADPQTLLRCCSSPPREAATSPTSSTRIPRSRA